MYPITLVRVPHYPWHPHGPSRRLSGRVCRRRSSRRTTLRSRRKPRSRQVGPEFSLPVPRFESSTGAPSFRFDAPERACRPRYRLLPPKHLPDRKGLLIYPECRQGVEAEHQCQAGVASRPPRLISRRPSSGGSKDLPLLVAAAGPRSPSQLSQSAAPARVQKALRTLAASALSLPLRSRAPARADPARDPGAPRHAEQQRRGAAAARRKRWRLPPPATQAAARAHSRRVLTARRRCLAPSPPPGAAARVRRVPQGPEGVQAPRGAPRQRARLPSPSTLPSPPAPALGRRWR